MPDAPLIRLRRLVDAAIAAESALDHAILEASDEAEEAAVAVDGHARAELLDALASLAGEEPCAALLPDGTLAVRSIDLDGLAIVPPGRVFHLEDPT